LVVYYWFLQLTIQTNRIMKANSQIIKAALFLSIIGTFIAIVFIINKNEIIIDFYTSVLALIGSAIGFFIGFFIKKIANKTDRRKVFLSYNIHDTYFATKVKNDLKENHIIVFNENDIIKPGDVLNYELETYIKQSDVFIIIISKNTYKSKFLKGEIEIAKKNNKLIIPIITEGAEIPNFLNQYKVADFRINYAESIKELVSTI
jgi:hypothetical protein